MTIVDQEVGSQGSGGKVVNAAGTVRHIPHNDGVCIREPGRTEGQGWKWPVACRHNMNQHVQYGIWGEQDKN